MALILNRKTNLTSDFCSCGSKGLGKGEKVEWHSITFKVSRRHIATFKSLQSNSKALNSISNPHLWLFWLLCQAPSHPYQKFTVVGCILPGQCVNKIVGLSSSSFVLQLRALIANFTLSHPKKKKIFPLKKEEGGENGLEKAEGGILSPRRYHVPSFGEREQDGEGVWQGGDGEVMKRSRGGGMATGINGKVF